MGVSPKSKGSGSPSELTLSDYRSEYSQADKFCQEVQSFIQEAGIPAINELRNAGYHLIRALNDVGGLGKQSELVRAINHCKRASYEAAEAGMLCALDKIAVFKIDYQSVPVMPVLPDYIDILQQAEAAKQALIDARSEEEDRHVDYERRITVFRDLKRICDRLDAARPEMNKAVNDGVADARRFIITALLSLAALIVAATYGWPAFKNATWPNKQPVAAAPVATPKQK